MKFGIKTLLAITFASSALCWFVVQTTPTSGSKLDLKNVPFDPSCPLTELPANATNVSYHYGGGRNPNTFYEFDINESDFKNWISSIPRFDARTDNLLNVIYRFGQIENGIQMLQITNGITYDWQHPTDGDQGEHIGYDRDAGRCYYQYHHF